MGRAGTNPRGLTQSSGSQTGWGYVKVGTDLWPQMGWALCCSGYTLHLGNPQDANVGAGGGRPIARAQQPSDNAADAFGEDSPVRKERVRGSAQPLLQMVSFHRPGRAAGLLGPVCSATICPVVLPTAGRR